VCNTKPMVHERVSVKSFVGLIIGNSRVGSLKHTGHLKGALQLLINRYGSIRFAQVPERVSTKEFCRFVILIGLTLSINHLKKKKKATGYSG